MKPKPFQIPKPERYDVATEVLSSAVRVLLAVGFSEDEVPKLFDQVAKRRARVPLWLQPVEDGVGSIERKRSTAGR